ncbi:MAG: hypothetical protein K8S55_10520 [Phycisphaerae bacterium]|nr:hypothetical protein [Phycisphaerae bacterium]
MCDQNQGGWLAGRVVVALAVLGACVAMVLFSVRTHTAEDLGYHLAYGEQFWDEGRLVEHSEFIYTLPPLNTPPDQRPEPGPACWYDAQGRYCFPNANWLTQVILAGVYRLAGVAGLSVLLAGLAALLSVLLAVFMRRMNLPWLGVAVGVLLVTLVVYPRLQLRPELLGYVVLVAQACCLGRAMRYPRKPESLRWRVIILLIFLQWLLVNLHSYFLLGLAISVAVLAEYALRWLVSWRSASADSDERAVLAGGCKKLAVLLAGQVAVCFANPWTWRLAVLPVQTLAYIRTHKINAGPGAHPWSLLGEFQKTTFLFRNWTNDITNIAFAAMLVCVAAALLAAVLRRRWSWLLVLVGMTMVAMSMQRNIHVAAMLLIPVSLAAIWQGVAGFAARYGGKVRQAGRLIIAVGILVGCVCVSALVVTNRLYDGEGWLVRFGTGYSRVHMPVGPARWLNEHNPKGRLWCCSTATSNLHFFTRPHREMPMITNTWSLPPATLQMVFDVNRANDRVDFPQLGRRYDISVVVTGPGKFFGQLRQDRRWALVFLEGQFAIFMRLDGPDGKLARQTALHPTKVDPAKLAARTRQLDPKPVHVLGQLGEMLLQLRWPEHAVAVSQATVDAREDAIAWNRLGLALYLRGMMKKASKQRGAVEDFRQAERAFARSMELGNTHPNITKNLQAARQQISHTE